MRWFDKVLPLEGAERTISVFPLFQLELNGEVRWLERCDVVERFYHNKQSGGGWGSSPQWHYDRFA